jgi:Fe-S-cluster-containing dehydrogenase component
VVTACQQTCPTQAITFGNVADSESQVAGQQRDQRAYTLLFELNNKPRIRYLGKLRNPPSDGSETPADEGAHS